MVTRAAVVCGVRRCGVDRRRRLSEDTVQRRGVGCNSGYQLLVEVVTAVVGVGERETEIAVLHTSGAQATCYNGGHILGCVRCDSVHHLRVGVEVVVRGSAFLGGNSTRNLFAARLCQISVEVHGSTGGVVVNQCLLAYDSVVEGLDDAAILSGESAVSFGRTILGVSALHRDKHRLGAGTEVVVLDKSTRACRHAYTVLGVTVEIVVIHVHAHRTDTGMPRVGVVKPVVMIRDVVRTALALHAAHAGFACVPEVVVTYGDELRVGLHVNTSVAFGFIA